MRLTTAFLMMTLAWGSAFAAETDLKPTKMYKWVDKDGVVNYSATPVEQADVTEIEIRRGPKAPPPPPPVAPLKQPLDCAQLRENVRLLQSDARNLQVVENGIPRPLTDAERVPQLEAAQLALKTCTEAAETPAAPPSG